MNARPHRPRTERPTVRDDEPRKRPASGSQSKRSSSSELAITLWVLACLLAVWLLYSWMFERIFSN